MATGLIIFNGWWGKKSSLLHPDSLLYKVKKLFIDKLLKEGLATNSDMDRRNNVPHIQLLLPCDEAKEEIKRAKFTINPNSEAQDRYDRMNKKKITLRVEDLIIQQDHVEIDTGDNTHMTLFFKRGLGKKENQELLKKLFRETLEELKV